MGHVTSNFKLVLAEAKVKGILRGGGASWTIAGVNQTFRNTLEMISFLEENPDEYYKLAAKCICVTRKKLKFPTLPPDGYIYKKFTARELGVE